MKKYITYFLLIALPAAVLVLSNLFQGYVVDSYRRISLSTGERYLYFFSAPLAVALLLVVLLYSLRFSKHPSYRVLLGTLAVGYLLFAYYTSFIDPQFIPMEPLARQFLVEDLPLYAGYYGGAWLFVSLLPKLTGNPENVNHHGMQKEEIPRDSSL